MAGVRTSLIVLTSIASMLYLFDLVFNLKLVTSSLNHRNEYSVDKKILADRRSWPTYTVFCPLYKETAILPQFIRAMNSLDYPKDRLNVMLLLEEDDEDTIAVIRNMKLPRHFSVVIVPHSMPKTKPKACNHGLMLANSEYAVIYDAEDVPQSDQLKKAVVAFEQAPGYIACLQAKLNFYNPNQNLLTRMFTLEYSLWFNLILVGLQNVKGPIPLGGTSNHFKVNILKALGGWDPFNVTEDCDLGIRLYKQGFQTGMLDSYTFEEANSQIKNWLRQRSRWIKGYIQTYLVHAQKPGSIKQHRYDFHIITFYQVVGGKVSTLFINPFMWVLTISYFAAYPFVGTFLHSIYPTPVFYIAVTSLVLGNLLYVYYYFLASAQREQWGLIKYALLVPIYWLMMSVAACYGLYQLVYRPHYWEKTEHGLHLAEAAI